jgi:hypothetical protein
MSVFALIKASVNNTTQLSFFSALLAHALVRVAEEDEEVEGWMIALLFPPPLRCMIGRRDRDVIPASPKVSECV